jgi:hypothetical protein
MGRNFLSSTQAVQQVIADLKPFTEMLPPQDRLIFDKFYEHALNNRAAIANAASLLPLEATLLILLLEEHKRTQRLYSELRLEIDRLKKAASRPEEHPSLDDSSP